MVIYFERLILKTDKEIMDFNQNGEERNVYGKLKSEENYNYEYCRRID